MANDAETKRLPPLVAGVFMSISIGLAKITSMYLGTGRISVVIIGIIILMILALTYEFVFKQ